MNRKRLIVILVPIYRARRQEMIGKSILHYKILEKLGSPREIIIFKIPGNSCLIIAPGKGGSPHEILVFTVLVTDRNIIYGVNGYRQNEVIKF
jgi:hypothetical protein